jgi:hypothetical protein
MPSIDFANAVLLVHVAESQRAYKLQHHADEDINDEQFPEQHVSSSEREGTPCVRLHWRTFILTINKRPFDLQQGWVFGSNDNCEFRLDEDSTRGVSGKHYKIDHDWVSKSLILTNISRNGTDLTSDSIGLRETVTGTWRIRPDERTTVEAGGSSVAIEAPRRGAFQSQYDENLDAYHREVQEALPLLGRLRFSGAVVDTPVISRGEVARDHFLLQEKIGEGQFGAVFKAFDCSNNRVYAAKRLFPGHASDKRIRAEINVLRKVSHVSPSHPLSRKPANNALTEIHCNIR